MQNFNFHNPTHIIFGKDRLSELNKLVPQNAKVLIAFGGGSIKKFGTFDKVVDALKDREIIEFGGIEPNPQFNTLMKAVNVVKNEKIDFILAVGGGSVIDGVKFIVMAAKYDGNDPERIFLKGAASTGVKEVVSYGTVLTLPATGTEMNANSVISYKTGKYPFSTPLVYPIFSILDPTLTHSLPKKQVANGVVDAFVHVMEQYMTYPVDGRFQDRTAEGILTSLIEIGKKTIDEPEDYDARANLVWCATMALNGVIGSGVPQDWATHQLGHEITAFYGVDHAQSLAVILPTMMDVRREQKKDKLIQYADRVWNISEGTTDEIIDKVIAQTREFFESLNVKTRLSDYGIPANGIDQMVKGLEEKGSTSISERGDLTLDISRKIFEMSL